MLLWQPPIRALTCCYPWLWCVRASPRCLLGRAGPRIGGLWGKKCGGLSPSVGTGTGTRTRCTVGTTRTVARCRCTTTMARPPCARRRGPTWWPIPRSVPPPANNTQCPLFHLSLRQGLAGCGPWPRGQGTVAGQAYEQFARLLSLGFALVDMLLVLLWWWPCRAHPRTCGRQGIAGSTAGAGAAAQVLELAMPHLRACLVGKRTRARGALAECMEGTGLAKKKKKNTKKAP